MTENGKHQVGNRLPFDGTNIRGVFFDLGGTLFSYPPRERLSRPLYKVLTLLKLQLKREKIRLYWKNASENIEKIYAKRSFFMHSDLFRDTLINFGEAIGVPVPEHVQNQYLSDQCHVMIEHLPLREDAQTTLKALKERGIYLAIVSNIDNDWLDPLVARHGLDKVLDIWISSEEAKSCKPDTGIFNYALDKAGIEACETLFVGDSLHHDVAGAKAAGLPCVRIVDESIPTPLTHGLEVIAKPDIEITELSELIGIIDRPIR